MVNLEKIASKENARAAAKICLDLFLDDSKTDSEKIDTLKKFLVKNTEHIDDNVKLVPGYGNLLLMLVDSKPVNEAQELLCQTIAETIVQAVKGLAASNVLKGN